MFNRHKITFHGGVYGSHIYHFVWTTKYRQHTLNVEIENAIKMIFNSKAKEMNLEMIEIEGAGDHIHVLLRANPQAHPSNIAKHLKGSSSHYVNHSVLPNDNERFYWQDGYGVVSVSPQAVKAVAQYVRNQKKHHRQGDLIHELENPGTSQEGQRRIT